jgi:cell division septation protein DedD
MMPVPIPDGPVPMAAPAAPAAGPQQVAAADPAPAPAESKYLVQVGAHKSQTEALAIYADIQQKNPQLLGNYPPLVQKTTAGGGTLYRLRVGPIASKSEAYKLCGDLKTQGTDCFVAVQ